MTAQSNAAAIDALWKHVMRKTTVPARSVHGPGHWARVERNGLYIGETTGANLTVVRLFALFHDSMRRNDHIDPGHGRRGAKFAASLRDRLAFIGDEEFDILYHACEWHTDRVRHEDPTIAACWDADRLDLGRVSIAPHSDYLNSEAARAIADQGRFDLLDARPLRALDAG